MKNLVYAFTLCFATLGPTKTIPVFYLAARTADWRTVLALAAIEFRPCKPVSACRPSSARCARYPFNRRTST